jgi:hypothetical protein
VPLDVVSGQDALVNCAGHVIDGERFVSLINRLVTCVDSLPIAEQPACWLVAGAALLDIDPSGRRGVDLPQVKSTYWPHRVNFERLSRCRFIPEATPEHERWLDELQRVSTSPENAARLMEHDDDIDVRPLLSQVKAPTLVMHCDRTSAVPAAQGRLLGPRFRMVDTSPCPGPII